MNTACCNLLLSIIQVFAQHIRQAVSKIIHFHNIYYSSPFAVMTCAVLSPYLQPRRCLLLPKPCNFQTEMKGRYYCVLFFKLLQCKEKLEYLFPSCKIIYMCVSVTVAESDGLFLKIGHKLNAALQPAQLKFS